MGPTDIAFLIFGGIAIMSLIAYVIQLAENRRKARQLRLMKLRGNIRKAHHLLINFPAEYQSPEILKLLTLYLTQHCKAALHLEASDNTRQILTETEQKKTNTPEPAPHPEGSVTLFPAPADAQRARAVIKELVKFLKEAETQGEISADICQSLIQQSKQCFERTEIDLHLHDALKNEAINNGKASFQRYKKCFILLSELNKNHHLDGQLFELRNRMNTLATLIEEKAEAERERIRQEEINKNWFEP
ncbi:MAG: hypothetical protein ACPGF7_07870 [Pontibacterium sp.]